MSFWSRSIIALSLSLVVSGQALAQPRADNEDALSGFLSSKGLIANLEGVRQNFNSVASQLVVHAMGFLGVPYTFGGTSFEGGFDCSGFVKAVYEQTTGLILPRKASDQAKATAPISKDELKPGDLVFFNTMRAAFSHVGIYVGDGKFIHSPRTGSEVRIEDMGAAYWAARFNGARRVENRQAP